MGVKLACWARGVLMDYETLLQKIEGYSKTFEIKCLGYSHFGRKIWAVERNLNADFATAIFVGGVHAREHITTDLLCRFLDDRLFDEIDEFNVSLVLMANPDGVELVKHGIESVPERFRDKVLKINGCNKDFWLWKANGFGEDINNNFDANFGTNVHSWVPSSSGFIGEFADSVTETKLLADYTRQKQPFFTVSYHSKGEEIYFNFFQEGRRLKRDRLIAERFAKSTGYVIRNVERYSSGGYKDWCVQKLKIPSLTIEIGSDDLAHPIKEECLDEIYYKHKAVAKDLKFAYNVCVEYGETKDEL